MINSTNAIILRTVPFGETSLVVTAYTKLYGLQSYMVKGARSTGKKGQSLRPYLQPAAMLELVVYHHPSDHLQYIREMRWARVYNHVLTGVVHNAVATYMVELLTRCLKQTENNPGLYEWAAQYFTLLDEADPAVVANLPLHFALFLAGELGFGPENNFSDQNPDFNLAEGRFTGGSGELQFLVEGENARLIHQLLSVPQPVTVYRVKMNREQRQQLLKILDTFFSLHSPGFGHMRSPEVLMALF